MKRPVIRFCFVAFLCLFVTATATSQTTESKPDEAKTSGSSIVVPAETLVPLMLKNAVNSRTAFVGQAIYCETIYPITVGNRIVIPVGSYVKGAVTEVVRPGRVKGKAQVGIRFDSITLPNGVTRSLRAGLSSTGGLGNETVQREEGKIIGEGSKASDAGKVATTAAQATVIGGLSSRSMKGAGVGAIAGGVGGLIWVLASRGKEIVLPPGYNLEFQLAAPLTFDRDEIGGSSRYDDGPAFPSAQGPKID
jgi:type IV secretion system protein VirB10